MKYSATILLFAAAVFWSSASARPTKPDVEQGILIDAFTGGVIQGLNEYVPEPHRSILAKKVHEARDQHWDNYEEYSDYIKSMLLKYVRESGHEESRRKRDVGSDDELSNEEKIIINVAYAQALASLAPPAQREALLDKYVTALEKDYENDDDFIVEAIKIFEEETGLDLDKIDEGKFAEFEKEFTAQLIIAIAAATPQKN